MANEKVQKVLLKRTTKTNAPNVPSGASYGELFINIASGANAHNKITTKQIGTGNPIVWSDDVANDKKYATKEALSEGLANKLGKNEKAVSATTAISATTSVSAKTSVSAITSVSATTAPWDGIIGKPTSYTPSAHTHKPEEVGLESALKYHGVTTTELKDGYTTKPIKIGGVDHYQSAGCVVIYTTTASGDTEFVWNGESWDKLGDGINYKVKQTAVSNPSANGNATAFIDSISQDTNGVITVTKKNLNTAIKVNSATTATSATTSVSANCVSRFYTTGNSYGDIVATNSTNALYYAGVNKVQLNFSTGDVKASSFTGTLNGLAKSATTAVSATTAKYLSNIELNFTPAESALTPDNVRTLLGDGGTIKRGFWAYASNGHITSATTGIGAIDLAGTTVIQAVGSQNCYTQLYLTPSTSTVTGAKRNEIFMYNNNGSDYLPSWTRVLTNRNCNEFKIASATTAVSATTAAKAVADGNGNNIVNTYATTGHTHSNYLSMKSCNNTDFNTLKTSGWYYGYTGMTNAAYPNSISVTEVMVYSADWLVQRQTKISNINGSTTDTWERHFSNGNTWSSWVKVSNTQADWDITTTGSSAYIKNKPNIIYGFTGATQQYGNSSGVELAIIEGTGGVDLSENTLYLPKLSASIITGGTFDAARIPTAIKVDSAKTATNATTATKANSATTVYSTTGNTSSTYQLLGTTASSSGAYGTIGSSLSSIKMNPSTGTLSATTFVGNLNGKIKATTGTSKYYLLGHLTSANTADSVYKNANVYMSGGTLYASSDERLKTFIENVDGDPEKIKQIPKVYFHWNDDEEKNRQLGTFAQGLETVYPELVCKDEDGTRGVSYDKLSVVSLAGIDKLYEMIQELQKKNEELEKRIKDLENK